MGNDRMAMIARSVLAGLFLIALAVAANAQQCSDGCAHGRAVCAMQARTAMAACMQDCGASDPSCRSACIAAVRATRANCRTARADCGTRCAAPASGALSCAAACGAAAKTCFSGDLNDGAVCVADCKASGAPGRVCLAQCAKGIGASGATCQAAFQACLIDCQGAASGACFDTAALQCTMTACDAAHPCAAASAFCSARCASTAPSGTCLDVDSGQCSDQPCSAAQPCSGGAACVTLCPPPPPRGHCVDPISNGCTDQPCDTPRDCPSTHAVCTLECPPPTPKAECDRVPCGGPCTISPTCVVGQPCPEFPTRLGSCAADAAGNCACQPAAPRPTPTPLPSCDSAACGGPCVLEGSPGCPPGSVCDDAVTASWLGRCEAQADGACQCVAPTPTIRPPDCSSVPCGGTCTIAPDCPRGGVCPQIVELGHCDLNAAGDCHCLPGAGRTPTPECSSDADCADASSCTADRCVDGVCEHTCVCLNAAGGEGCCAGPSALCVRPCGSDATGTCGGACPYGASCQSASATKDCLCVSGPGGPCGGNVFDSAPVCAPGLVCRQSLPDATGHCEKPDCVPLFTSGCSDTTDCCEPCGNGSIAPCGVCLNGTCEGVP